MPRGRDPASTDTLVVVLFGLAVVCAFVAGFVAAGLWGGTTEQPPTNGSVGTPGSGFSGIVGAQEAEVRNEYEDRSFAARLAGASSNESRAAVMRVEAESIAARLDTLAARGDELRAVDDDREYRTRVTGFVAQTLVLEQRIDRLQQATATLQPSTRAAFDLTDQRLQSFQERVDALVTPEMVALARGVAGDDVGDDLDEEDDDDDNGDDSDDGDDGDDADDNDGDDDNEDGSADGSGTVTTTEDDDDDDDSENG